MSGFVEEVLPIDECLDRVVSALRFPWADRDSRYRSVGLRDALFARAAVPLRATENNPPFTRSLRDGYTLKHADTTGASPGAPVFLHLAGEVAMGATPAFEVGCQECALIPTGGMLPEGADSVVMLEDSDRAGEWIEIRRAVSRGENLIFTGEDVAVGADVIARGSLIDVGTIGLLSTLGITSVAVSDWRIGLVSTGDEVVPVETSPLPVGSVRDVNAGLIASTLKKYGFDAKYYGIAVDEAEELRKLTDKALGECDVVVLSGGSSVGARDHTVKIIDELDSPGLLVRGVNMTPGKPTLIGGSADARKMVIGLPGHPLSCLAATIFILLPLLLKMIGSEERAGRYLDNLILGEDLHGRTGPDEFIPMKLERGAGDLHKLVYPLPAKSGYISPLSACDGFVRLSANTETLRKGETVSAWIW